jgi:thymidylate synthase (FAD)
MSIDGEEILNSEAIDAHRHRPVKLVSYSQMDYDYSCDKGFGGETLSVQDLIAFCARVSNPNNQNNTKTSNGLINYLIKHKHWSPFEMVSVCLEINTTRDIARQILRHRSFSFQEFSQRYADPIKDLEFELREARLQDTSNRQNSIEIKNSTLQTEWANKQLQINQLAEEIYKWAIDQGVAKEVARSVLPEGTTKSKMYMQGTIRSWIHYIEIRTDPSTQKEHRIIAQNCAHEITKIIPSICNFMHNDKASIQEWIGL